MKKLNASFMIRATVELSDFFVNTNWTGRCPRALIGWKDHIIPSFPINSDWFAEWSSFSSVLLTELSESISCEIYSSMDVSSDSLSEIKNLSRRHVSSLQLAIDGSCLTNHPEYLYRTSLTEVKINHITPTVLVDSNGLTLNVSFFAASFMRLFPL